MVGVFLCVVSSILSCTTNGEAGFRQELWLFLRRGFGWCDFLATRVGLAFLSPDFGSLLNLTKRKYQSRLTTKIARAIPNRKSAAMSFSNLA